MPTCNDSVANGQETDVDCGGPDCPGGADGASCKADSDCQNVCSHKTRVICENGQTRTRQEACGFQDRGDAIDECQNDQWMQTHCKDVWYRDGQEIYQTQQPNPSSGTYTIDPDSPNGSLKPFQVRWEMVDGAGGIKVELNNPNDDNLFTTNNPDKCGNMRRYHQVNLDPSSVSPDFNYSNCSDQTSANPLTYRNPTTGSDCTPEQIESIRNRITRLHPDTRRIAHTCDDDGRDPNNEVYINDSQVNRRHLTPGTTENEDGPWYIYHTTDGETTTHSANVGAQKLAADEILPTRLDDGSYSSSLCGGGLIRSYEKQHALVR